MNTASDGDRRATIFLPARVRHAIVAHAFEAWPRECCGLLVGDGARIDESVRTPNVDPDPARYRVDPAEHIRVNRTLRDSGRQVVGVYHSHPRGPAEPSPSDVAEALYPEFIHVIVAIEHRLEGSSGATLRGFRIANGEFDEIRFEETLDAGGS